MRSIVSDRVAWSVGLLVSRSVCWSVTVVSPAETAESIKMPLGCELGWAQIRWGPDPPWKGAILRGRACQDMPDDTTVSCAKTAEPIEMPFGLWIRVGRRKNVLHRDAHCRNLANTIKPSVCDGDAALPICQITLTTCYSAKKMKLRRVTSGQSNLTYR